jgi:hypothetical protein
MFRLLFGARIQLPTEILSKYPQLRQARFRVGGLPPKIAGFALGDSTVAAITLGSTVFISPRETLTPALLLHEFRHVEQHRESKTFPIQYLWECLRKGYKANRFEVDADNYSVDQMIAVQFPNAALQPNSKPEA